MNLDHVVAIDVHTHATVSTESVDDERSREVHRAASAYFKADSSKSTLDELASYYRERKMMAVVFPVDSEAGTGRRRIPNEEVAEAAARHDDVLIPFASVEPAKGKRGVREVRRLIEGHGVRGFKFHPNLQEFFPNDHSVYPMYEPIAEAGLIALFHTGHTGIGAGSPGGGGVRLKYSNPMHVDDVAVDFPELDIILAHPSFPWQDEALSVCLHKPRVYIDLSGWSPRYFPANLVQYANTLLQDKVLFGSDYPLLKPDRWLADFAELDIRDSVRPKILKDNAVRLLGLEGRGDR